MRVIEPSYEILPKVTTENCCQVLEQIGRVCYKSEDRITDDSFKTFITNIRNRGHWAMLEHANFTFGLSALWYELLSGIDKNNDLSRWIRMSKRVTANNKSRIYFNVVTVSLTSILTLLNYYKHDSNVASLGLVASKMVKELPIDETIKEVMFGNLKEIYNNVDKSFDEERDSHGAAFIPFEEVEQFDPEYKRRHMYMSVKFICDRGVSHELVRHRCSFAQESTRYCNYSKDKFGNEITVIKPLFFDPDAEKNHLWDESPSYNNYNIWENAMKNIEKGYFGMIENGASPQEARSILPNSLKTEIVVTMTLGQWNHFFHMRVPKTAHPQMRQLSIPLYDETVDLYGLDIIDPILVDDKGAK